MSAKNDAAFLRMFLLVLGALVAFTIIILIAANQIIGSVEEERGQDPRLRAAIVERIQPVGSVNVATKAADAAAAAPKSGAEIVAASCNACHATGVLESPKIGDKDAWSKRLAAQGGLDGLTASAIQGKGGMPPKGGAMVSDAEIRAAIEHMLAESGVDVAAVPAEAAAEPASSGTVEQAVTQLADDAGQMVDNAVEVAKTAAATVMPSSEPAAGEADLAKGKAVYDGACFVCHMTGAAGAPKLGDNAAWAPRIAQGKDTLYASVLNGKGAMPPKGGRMDIPDADVKAAVDYMVDQAK